MVLGPFCTPTRDEKAQKPSQTTVPLKPLLSHLKPEAIRICIGAQAAPFQFWVNWKRQERGGDPPPPPLIFRSLSPLISRPEEQ
jgi:hypothetical protein